MYVIIIYVLQKLKRIKRRSFLKRLNKRVKIREIV